MNSKPSERPSTPAPHALSRKLRILIADDSRDTVLTFQLLLRDEGHEVRGVYTGSDALRAARQVAFDAILLDIEMPDLSGYAIAQELRTSYYGSRGPLLIAISGKWNEPSEKLLSRAVGFDHHLTKPCDPGELARLLQPLTLPPPARAG